MWMCLDSLLNDTPMTDHNDGRVHIELTVTGVVQAVGFRPFVYRRATAHDLVGTVRNTGDAGVKISIAGTVEDVEAFIDDVRERPPPLAVVESIDIETHEPVDDSNDRFQTFEIVSSTQGDGGSGTIPPDTGICDGCLEDVHDLNSRYYKYWATSCVDCGPRYTVIESLPYDRPTTTMESFPLCEGCNKEYTDPGDRRYHAQTIACPACGPSLSLLSDDRTELATGTDAVTAAGYRLNAGEILAIKGIGGTHLACRATDQDAVSDLRERTGRPEKPFALMAKSVEQVEQFARVGQEERPWLTDVRRPIVVLETLGGSALNRDRDWLGDVAPGLHTVGVMLPYAGLHHLLFDQLDEPLVMTSANLPGKPMTLSTEVIYEELADVIDAAVVHDREIAARCDDSVVRVVDNSRRFLRRSRGWVPRPLPRQETGPAVLALGAEFDTTVALAREDEVVLSQHLGDVDGPGTEAFLEQAIAHLKELFRTDPAIIACDLHPEFVTSRLATSYASDLPGASGPTNPIQVQHHHAHAAGLLAEHDCDRAVVITIDGTGYGPDGTVWGGEVLDVTRNSFERVGGLEPFRLPGGEAAVRYPARTLASLLNDAERVDELIADQTPLSQTEATTVRKSAEAGVNAPLTSSAGRYLDAISALLEVCTERTYQGEPAIKLESTAASGTPLSLEHELEGNTGHCYRDADKYAGMIVTYALYDDRPVIETSRLVRHIDRLHTSYSTATVAATAQAALAEGLALIAVQAARERAVPWIGVTGGVAHNVAISRRIRDVVEDRNFRFLSPDQIPPGDAGISYGQTVVATAQANARGE
ncbi:carbamoyltransferase HypF [Natrarchaeobaculum sulfurireducens]|uniref:Carbamoyltransferase n=1 Tax=Natrarchaeobaculum sulfurireducens TaxID=2044521 RepID=A0A346P9X1_9EURY|nr:carbamoyltransferase HypF [Natrarchaeobaculum sulfurireducens]AXR76316.1 hydrogenase maturation protein HypF [Natrarchaeobaculum sulfurireducens]